MAVENSANRYLIQDMQAADARLDREIALAGAKGVQELTPVNLCFDFLWAIPIFATSSEDTSSTNKPDDESDSLPMQGVFELSVSQRGGEENARERNRIPRT